MTSSGAEDVWRECAPHVLAALVRRYGDFDLAEDATQEALLAAARQWPADGVPDNPRGLADHASRRGAWSTACAVSGPAPTASGWSPGTPDPSRTSHLRPTSRPSRPGTSGTTR